MSATARDTELTATELALQSEVREFLAAELPRGSFVPGLGMVGGRDPEFSRKLAQRGWLGMSIPAEHGGAGRSAVERFIVVEELLRWGAPVEHHWNADRQIAPILARYGTPEQRRRFVDPICAGELSFALGMSEPDAGSDLAAVATRAVKVERGWRVNGTKIWTSGAHESDWFIILCRTSDEEDRRQGLSRLIVDLHGEGVTVKPIEFLDGTSEFNEVSMVDVFVPDDLLVGEVGAGWSQNVAELVYERGGPERWLSPYLLVEQLLREHADGLPDAYAAVVADATAAWWAMRRLSLQIARKIDRGEAPAHESALVKDIGTRFEQKLVADLLDVAEQDVVEDEPGSFRGLLFAAVLNNPAWTLRGGTTEILRTIITRGLR
ncbi:acyl-CoA dehydrogenase family protein [Microbacterium sp. LWH7-1.2]|uniref:acyl-CoA dehydrogenase family protein n=1 Tax=Microbacterium sp. LWH7-1.2 TaxID=3135257 RepID=UPI00313A0940